MAPVYRTAEASLGKIPAAPDCLLICMSVPPPQREADLLPVKLEEASEESAPGSG